ncbi:hypothetical protein [Brevibacillus migulae]|uniref:hypothetical protein n=1 Tax=Brevibacillus migulae TaxID=1644114 RepID=UPI00106E6EB1|nr:hypothetical protein [Brevibacillus migulae]
MILGTSIYKSYFETVSSQQVMTAPMPEDFAFSLSYGVDAKNTLNTFNQSYTKDMVTEPPLTVPFTLSKEEMQSIYKEMAKINLFHDKVWDLKPWLKPCMKVPFHTYSLKVQANGKVWLLHWDDENCKLTEDQQALNSLVEYIRGVLEKNDQYRRLPAPKGGYAHSAKKSRNIGS